jgi:hypothetical protein
MSLNGLQAWYGSVATIVSIGYSIRTKSKETFFIIARIVVGIFDVVEEHMWVGFSSSLWNPKSYDTILSWTFKATGIGTVFWNPDLCPGRSKSNSNSNSVHVSSSK